MIKKKDNYPKTSVLLHHILGEMVDKKYVFIKFRNTTEAMVVNARLKSATRRCGYKWHFSRHGNEITVWR